MIDIREIRETPDRFKQAVADKHIFADIDALLAADNELSELKRQLQDIATEKNRIGKSIPQLAGDDKQTALNQLAELKKNDVHLNEKIKSLAPRFDELMLQVPQPADEEVIWNK